MAKAFTGLEPPPDRCCPLGLDLTEAEFEAINAALLVRFGRDPSPGLYPTEAAIAAICREWLLEQAKHGTVAV